MAVGIHYSPGMTREEYKSLLAGVQTKLSTDNCFMLKKQALEIDDTTMQAVIEDSRITENSCISVTFHQASKMKYYNTRGMSAEGKVIIQSDILPESIWEEDNVIDIPFSYGCSSFLDNNGVLHIVLNDTYYTISPENGLQIISSNIPETCYKNANTIFYNSEGLHILGCNETAYDGLQHLLFDGTNWSYQEVTPVDFTMSRAIEDSNGVIHLFGGIFTDTKSCHYTYNNGVWNRESDLPIEVAMCAVVIDNEGCINIMGGYNPVTDENNYAHYRLSDVGWELVTVLPNTGTYKYSGVVSDNGEIHLIGSDTEFTYTSGVHLVFRNGRWIKLPGVDALCKDALVYKHNGTLYTIGFDAEIGTLYRLDPFQLTCNILVMNQ